MLSSAAVDVTPSRMLSSAAVDVTVVPLIENASVSNVPSMSTLPLISSSVATTLLLKVAAPASDMSNVKAVISELPSVPLNIISVSPPWASIVMLPAEVARVTAASPVVILSAAIADASADI